MSEIIDVFRGAGKMDKFVDGIQFWQIGNALFNQVFHRLDVVICGSLDLFDAQRLIDRKIANKVI